MKKRGFDFEQYLLNIDKQSSTGLSEEEEEFVTFLKRITDNSKRAEALAEVLAKLDGETSKTTERAEIVAFLS